MAGKNQHVIPCNGKWAVISEGSKRVTAIYDSKQEAIDAARKIARSQVGRLVVHGRSGQIFQKPEARSSVSESTIRNAVRSGMPQMMRTARAAKKASENPKRTAKN